MKLPDDNLLLREEVKRLESVVEDYRLREIEDLRMALESAQKDVQHYRAEAQRNADLGREIAAEYQVQIAKLGTKGTKLDPAARKEFHGFDRRRTSGV